MIATLWALAGLLGAVQESDADRLRRLEEQVKKQQTELDALKPAAKPEPDDAGMDVFWRNGLRIRSRDGRFEARFGARAIVHARTVFDRPDDTSAPLRSVPDSIFFREAYLEAEATLDEEFAVKVQADFKSGTWNQSSGSSPSSVQGTLRDAFIEWRRWEAFKLRLGQFYEPVSLEDRTSFRFIDFAERSVMNRLMIGREIGLEARGEFGDEDLLSYRVMFSNGASLLADQGRSVSDREDEKHLAGLLGIQPFDEMGLPWLAGLGLAVGGSIEDVDNVAASGFDLTTTELSVLYLDSTAAGTFDGRRTRLVPQLTWRLGPLYLQGEYLIRRDELDDTFADSTLKSRGWYAYATWVVTGEDKAVRGRPSPASEWGLVEVGVRVARVEVENAFDAGLAAPAGNAERVTSVTGGVNWWIRPFFRFTLNVVREDYDDELDFDTRSEDTLWGVIVRAQIDF